MTVAEVIALIEKMDAVQFACVAVFTVLCVIRVGRQD